METRKNHLGLEGERSGRRSGTWFCLLLPAEVRMERRGVCSFPDPPASSAVSCDPSSCCQLAEKLGTCLAEDSCPAALPFPVAVVSPLVLFLSVGSSCTQKALKSVLRWLSQANPINLYISDSIGWKGRCVSLSKKMETPLPRVTSSSADLLF